MKKNLKDMTNVQVVKHIMETGSPMNQLFVMDALTKWSDHIVKNEAETIKQLEGTMIYGPAWVAAAKHVQSKLNEFYQQ